MDDLDAIGDRLTAFAKPDQPKEWDFGSTEATARQLPALMTVDPQGGVKAALKSRLPADSLGGVPDQVKEAYGNELRLEQERDRFKGAQESTQGFITRRMAPFVSAVHNVREEAAYADAVKRFRAGRTEEGDYAKIAGYERLQQIDKERSTGESIGAGVAHVPAILGEGWVAGKALGLGARALRGAEAVAPLAAGETVAQTSRLSQLGSFAGTTALKTGLMPSMYLAEAGKRAVANDGEWYHAKNLAPAFGMGMATVAVLGSLQEFVNEGSVAYQIAGKTLVGMGEQQAVDVSAQVLSDAVLNKAWKVETGYGLAGDVFRAANGKDNQALKHALTQASVFGVFSAMHVFGHRKGATVDQVATEAAKLPAEVMAKYKEYVEKGYATLADKLLVDYARAQTEITQHPNPTKETVEAVAAEMTPGPFADIVKKQADHLPTAEEAAKLLEGIVNRSSLDDALQRTAQREAEARARGKVTSPETDIAPKTETPNPPAEPPVPDVVTHDPVEVLGEAGVREFAKPLGLRSNAKIETILAGISKSPTLRAILENRVRNKVRESAQRTLPEVPETTRGPETAPESPVAGDGTKPEESPSERADRLVEAAKRHKAGLRLRVGEVEAIPTGTERFHVADYKNPSESVSAARKLLLGESHDLWTWTGGEHVKGTAGKGAVTFVLDRGKYSGKTLSTTANTERLGSTDSMRTEPGLKRMVYEGSEGDAKFREDLKPLVDAVNTERSLRGLPPVELVATDKTPPTPKGKSPEWVATFEAMRKLVGDKMAAEMADKDHPPSPETDIAPEPITPRPAKKGRPVVPPPSATVIANRGKIGEALRARKALGTKEPDAPKPVEDPIAPREAPEDIVAAHRERVGTETVPNADSDNRSRLDAMLSGDEAAALTDREKHVLSERLAGKTHPDIAAEGHESGALVKIGAVKNKGTPYTRERVRQIEKGALVKLGESSSVRAQVNDVEAREKAGDLLDSAKRIDAADIDAGVARVLDPIQERLDAVENQLEKLHAEYADILRRNGRLTPTEEADYVRRSQALYDASEGRESAAARTARRDEERGRKEGATAAPETHPGVAAALTERAKAPGGSAARRVLDAALGNLDAHPDEGTPRTGHDPKEVARRLVSARMELDNPALGATGKDVNALDRVLKAAGVGEIGGRVGEVVPFDPVIHHDPGVPTGTPVKVVRPGWELPGKSRYILEPAKVEPARAGNADFPPSRGSAAPKGASPEADLSAAPVTPAQIVAEIGATLGRVTGVGDYGGEKRVPGGGYARADLRSGQTTASKQAALDPFTALEEQAHHLGYGGGKDGIETNPKVLDRTNPGVVDGLMSIDKNFFDNSHARTPVAVVEGFGAYVKLRAAGRLGELETADQKAAAEWAEDYLKRKGFDKPLDELTPLFRNYAAQNPEQRAAGLGSSRTRPPEKPETAAEVVTRLGERFAEDVDNDLAALVRLERDANAARKQRGQRPLSPEEMASTKYATLMNAGKALAGVFERDGIRTLEGGKWVSVEGGIPLAKILEGADPKWLEPGANGASSRAGTYAVAKHVVGELTRWSLDMGHARADLEAARAKSPALIALHERAVDIAEVRLKAARGENIEAAKSELIQAKNRLREAKGSVAKARSRFLDIEGDSSRKDLVTPEQYAEYEKAYRAAQTDPAFVKWADPFSAKLTKAFLASRLALESSDIHLHAPGTAKKLDDARPDYVPTDRVRSDLGWNQTVQGKKGERAGTSLFARSGSGEAIIDPLLSYKKRLLETAERIQEQVRRNALFALLKQPGMGGYAAFYDRAGKTPEGKERADQLRRAGVDPEAIDPALRDAGAENVTSYFHAEPWPTDGTKPTLEWAGPGGVVESARIGDRALYELATNQQVDSHQAAKMANMIANASVFGVQPIKGLNKLVRFGATTLSAAFQLKNIPRDWFSQWKNTIDRSTSGTQMAKEYWAMYGRMWRYFQSNKAERKGGARTDQNEYPLFQKWSDLRGQQQKQYAFERDNPDAVYAGLKPAHSVWGLARDFLNFAGAGELAPRFLEFKTRLKQLTGKTEGELNAAFAAADRAAREGGKYEEPVPFAQLLDAMNFGAEVTTPFGRQGVLTRQVNQITPFFGPAVAGLSKSLRNFSTNPKGAYMALGAVMALRTLHWLMYSDEPWYRELSANDRFNNFVVWTPAGLRRLPGPRDLELAVGGTVVTLLDAANNKHPDFKGLMEQSLEAVLPPGVGPAATDVLKGDVGMGLARAGAIPAGPAGQVGVEMMMNKDWRGQPIVPRREEGKTSQWDQFADRYGPYAAKQLTGGRADLSNLQAALGANPVPRVMSLHRSVDELYDRLHELEIDKAKAAKAGTKFSDAAEYSRLEAARKQITDLVAKGRGEKKIGAKVIVGERPEDDIRQELSLKQAEIARRALRR